MACVEIRLCLAMHVNGTAKGGRGKHGLHLAAGPVLGPVPQEFFLTFAEQLQAECGFPIASFGHAGDGNIHVNIMVPNMTDPEIRERAEAALDRLFKQVIAWNGAITGEHGVGIAKGRWFADAVGEGARELHRRLKLALDAEGILNPGKFAG